MLRIRLDSSDMFSAIAEAKRQSLLEKGNSEATTMSKGELYALTYGEKVEIVESDYYLCLLGIAHSLNWDYSFVSEK